MYANVNESFGYATCLGDDVSRWDDGIDPRIEKVLIRKGHSLGSDLSHLFFIFLLAQQTETVVWQRPHDEKRAAA